jgi:hypothetical protein
MDYKQSIGAVVRHFYEHHTEVWCFCPDSKHDYKRMDLSEFGETDEEIANKIIDQLYDTRLEFEMFSGDNSHPGGSFYGPSLYIDNGYTPFPDGGKPKWLKGSLKMVKQIPMLRYYGDDKRIFQLGSRPEEFNFTQQFKGQNDFDNYLKYLKKTEEIVKRNKEYQDRFEIDKKYVKAQDLEQAIQTDFE